MILIKFIFPQNYKFNNKLFGFIDYSSAFINILWNIFLFCVLNLLFKNIYLKISLFILFSLPLFIITFVGINHENIFYVINYIYKFIKNRHLYFFDKK